MPTFLLFGQNLQDRIHLLTQLAAIAEQNLSHSGDLLFFEGSWNGSLLRVETLATDDLPSLSAQSDLADYVVPVISEADGPMPGDVQQLANTPPRVEIPAVLCVHPSADAETSLLVHTETTELIKVDRPNWTPRFVHTECRSFMFLLARSFFTDCVTSFND